MSKRTSARSLRILKQQMQEGPKPEPEVKNALVVVDEPKNDRTITLMRDHKIEYQELWCDVFVTEPGAEVLFAEMFARARCRQAKTLEDADIVVFTGGADIRPELYGERSAEAHEKCKFDSKRDDRDMRWYAAALRAGIPMLGVCRGSQFLHAMNGGKLHQHIDGHVGPHSMLDVVTRTHIDRVSSTHHQSVIPNNRMHILATAEKSTERWINKRECDRTGRLDVEAFFYPDTCCLGIQGHPEFRGFPRYTAWVLDQIQQKILHNPKVSLEKSEDGRSCYRFRTTKEVVILEDQSVETAKKSKK